MGRRLLALFEKGYHAGVITRAFIQEQGNGKLGPESASLTRSLGKRGISFELFTEKKIFRRQLPVSRTTLVAGSIPSVHQALSQLEVPVPEPNDYPRSLMPHLHRKIWESNVGVVVDGFLHGDMAPIFVKPKGRLKRFTGRLFSSRDDLGWLEGASRKQPVYCSEQVEWKSEFRAYVVRGAVVGVLPYWGDPGVLPSKDVIKEAVERLESSHEGYAGYGIDFGVLASGETALVEMNDGFGLGSYGLDDDLYADLVMARWAELVDLGK